MCVCNLSSLPFQVAKAKGKQRDDAIGRSEALIVSAFLKLREIEIEAERNWHR